MYLLQIDLKLSVFSPIVFVKLVRLGEAIKSELVNGDTARLEISKVEPLHEGLYTCTAFNELGQDSTSARLILSSTYC